MADENLKNYRPEIKGNKVLENFLARQLRTAKAWGKWPSKFFKADRLDKVMMMAYDEYEAIVENYQMSSIKRDPRRGKRNDRFSRRQRD